MTEPIPKPEAAPPVWENIPRELAERQRWLLWKFEEPEKPGQKWRKVPYYVAGGRRTGDQGSDRDLQRLAVLEVVRRAHARGGWDGVGFAFTPGDGLVGIDLDGAIAEDGEINARHDSIIRSCPGTYVEYSPSGLGCHIIGTGDTATAKSNDIGVEMFCGSQFFTVTGRLWPGAVPAIAPIAPMVFEGLHAMIAAAKEAGRRQRAQPEASTRPAQRRGDETFEQLRARVESALASMRPDMAYDDWIAIGWALRDAFGDQGFDLWNGWSASGSTYPGEEKLRSHWRSFRSSGKAAEDVVGVIFARARDAGWNPPRRPRRDDRQAPAATSGAAAGGGSSAPPPPTPPADDFPPHEEEERPSRDVSEVLLRGKRGPEDCRENVLYCLRHDPELQGLVAHNQFTELQDKTRRPPWGGEPGEWTEEDDLMLGEYLARSHQLLIKGTGTLKAGVQMAARENKYHPVLEQLRQVEWDGTERLDTWLSDCLGAVDRPYVRLVSRFFIMGMVARLLRPGCKFDYMLILQGGQGLGKSSAFRILGGEYFMDTPFRIGDKDSYLSLQGVWLVEFSELEAMSKSESTAIKAFVTSPEDRFRPPYGSRMVKLPRRVVLAGTTNADQFLKDATGDRRFWPVHVTEIRQDLLKACRDQLFAEALHRLEQEKDPELRRYYPTRTEEAELFHPEQDRWRMVDVWTDILADYLAREFTAQEADPNEPPPAQRGFFTAQELFSKALGIKAERMDNARLMQVRVATAMRELGYAAEREPGGARKRGYLRPGWEFRDGKARKITAPQASTDPGGGDALPI